MKQLIRWCRIQWDRTLGIALAVAGALAMVIGWIGVSGALLPAEQLPYILSGGIGGLFLLGAGATMWLSADLRDEWRKLDRLEASATDVTAARASETSLRSEAEKPAARRSAQLSIQRG